MAARISGIVASTMEKGGWAAEAFGAAPRRGACAPSVTVAATTGITNQARRFTAGSLYVCARNPGLKTQD